MASSEPGNGSDSVDPPPTSETMSYKSLPRVGFRPMTAYRTVLPTPPPSLGSQSKGPQEKHTPFPVLTEPGQPSMAKRGQYPEMNLLQRQLEHLQQERKQREEPQVHQERNRDEAEKEQRGQEHGNIPKSSSTMQRSVREDVGQGRTFDKGRSILRDEPRDKQAVDLQSRKKVIFDTEMKSKQPAELGLQGKAGIHTPEVSHHRKARTDGNTASGRLSSLASKLAKGLEARNALPSRWYTTDEEETSDSDMSPPFAPRPSAISSYYATVPSKEPPTERGMPENEPKKSEYKTISPPDPTVVDTVYASIGTRDHTVHLELDLMNDIDEELEEFSRLVRTGSFAIARSFFDLHLKAHISDPYVFVQYAEMLLEQGDFKSLLAMDGSSLFDGRDLLGDMHSAFGSEQRLGLNWKLVRALALCCSQHGLRALKILLLTMRLTKLVATPSILGNFAERQLTDWVDWKMLYRQLLAEDRIWDFRDVFLAVSACYSTEDALRTFFDYDPSMESLLVDWQTELQDESTNLALLDILSLTALATGTYTGVHYLAESCVQLAEPIGNSLLNSSPHIIHSRPFLRWVVAKAVVNSGPRNFKYFSDYPGLTVFPRIEGMPYYIPISQENPSWLPLDAKPGSHESLQLALKSSRIIRDYKTESLCLRELALRTQDPGELLHELGKLQRFTQHNMDGYLVTLLSRYLVCRDYSSKGELLKDMESFGIWNDPSDLVNPTGVAARAVLQHALSRDPADNAGQSLGSALRYYEYLPKPFQRLIDRHYPVPRSTVSRDGLGSPLSISTKRPSWAKSSQEKKPHSIPESETTVRIDRDQDEGLIINIKGPQAHDQSVPSSQSADHLQAGESKPRQRRNAKSSQALGKQKSQDISKREDLTPESFRDLVRFGAPGHRDSLTDSDDSSVSSSDSSTTESRTEDTEAAKHGVKTIKDVDTERVMDSTGAHSGKQSRSRSESLQDPVRQADTESPPDGMSAAPHDSTTAKGSLEKENKHFRGSMKATVSTEDPNTGLNQSSPPAADKQPQAD